MTRFTSYILYALLNPLLYHGKPVLSSKGYAPGFDSALCDHPLTYIFNEGVFYGYVHIPD
jgi:hypothetical protein